MVHLIYLIVRTPITGEAPLVLNFADQCIMSVFLMSVTFQAFLCSESASSRTSLAKFRKISVVRMFLKSYIEIGSNENFCEMWSYHYFYHPIKCCHIKQHDNRKP